MTWLTEKEATVLTRHGKLEIGGAVGWFNGWFWDARKNMTCRWFCDSKLCLGLICGVLISFLKFTIEIYVLFCKEISLKLWWISSSAIGLREIYILIDFQINSHANYSSFRVIRRSGYQSNIKLTNHSILKFQRSFILQTLKSLLQQSIITAEMPRKSVLVSELEMVPSSYTV